MWTPERGDAPMTPTSRGSPLSSVRPSLLCQSEHYYTFTMTYDCVWDSLISGSCFLSLSVFCLCHSLPPASVDGNLYAGVHVDFMGTDPAIFRTMGSGPATRTEQYYSRWLNGTSQISSHLISYVVQIVQIELTVSWILTSAVGSGCFTWACCVLIAYTCIPLSKYFLAHLALHLDTPPPTLSFLSEPVFTQIRMIPDSAERNDDKLYFFFREKTLDSGGSASPSVLARVGRICLVIDRPCLPQTS